LGSANAWGKLTVLNVPDVAIIDGPGYRIFYGEETKRATEGSVLTAADAPVKARWGWEYSRSESVSLNVADWWVQRLNPTTAHSF
jgi:hypothetical protein